MFIRLFSILLLIVLSPVRVQADEVLGKTWDVEFVTVARYDAGGHAYAYDVFAVNNSSYRMRVGASLSRGFNVDAKLKSELSSVAPGERYYLGSVEHKDLDSDWQWWVAWEVRTDCNGNANRHPACFGQAMVIARPSDRSNDV